MQRQGNKSGSCQPNPGMQLLTHSRCTGDCNILNTKFKKKNNELVEFWKKSSSHVWKHFAFEVKVVDGKKCTNKKRAICKLCKSDFVYSGGTTNLSNHLRAKHKIYATNAADNTESLTQKQALIKDAFGITPPISAFKKHEMDTKVENFVVNGSQPLSVVEDESFIELMKTAIPLYSLPARSTLVTRLRKRYCDMTSQLQTLLLTIFACSITYDSHAKRLCNNYSLHK